MLNTIPDDCIMEVFSYLGERELCALSYVCHRLFFLSRVQLKKVNESQHGMLRIVENEYGHAFTLLYKGSILYYCFTFTDCYERPAARRFTFSNDDIITKQEYEKMLLFEKYYVTKYASVPSILLSQLDILLAWHSFTALCLKNVRIDSNFMTFLENAVHKMEDFNLIGIKIDDDCKERFYLFTSKFKLESLHIKNSESAFQAFNNETFIEDFFRETKCAKGGDFYVESPAYITQECRFYPSKGSAVDYITRCWGIEDPSLTIDPLWIPQIIEKRMKNWHDIDFVIIVALSEMPTEWDFSEYPNLMVYLDNGYKFRQKHRSPSHLVIDSETGYLISFSVYLEGGIIRFHAIACYLVQR